MAKVIGEIWKSIPGYEGLYEVSNIGNVRSLFRYKKTLKPSLTNNGYLYYQLFKNKVGKNHYAHRLVATAFVPKEEGKEIVNHKDENKTNNCAENLEWVSHIENCRWGTAIARRTQNIDYSKRKVNNANQIKVCSKPILMYTKNGEFIREWSSASECVRQCGFSSVAGIRRCVSGERKTAFGYVFKERGNDLLAR